LISLTQQELEICYILSEIFNVNISYEDILWDIQQDTERYQKDKELYHKYAYLSGKEECFAIFRVKRKYKEVKKQILSIKSDFTQKDLERLFYITGSYCLKNRMVIDDDDWVIEEGWNKIEFMENITKIKEVSFFRKKYINFRVKNHYKILCFVFGFTHYCFEEQKSIFKKHSSIHLHSSTIILIVYIFAIVGNIIFISIAKHFIGDDVFLIFLIFIAFIVVMALMRYFRGI
jgi:hypothetical protein